MYAEHFGERGKTPQREQADPRQVPNSAGGFAFKVDCWQRLDRFLILGAEGGTFYAGERELVVENVKGLGECLDEDPARAVEQIAQVSESGRAPKNDAAIFALAYAAGHPKARELALKALPRVCRIGTHLFDFMNAVQKFRGWGRGLQRAVAAWYNDRDPDSLMRQVTKYQQRNGVSHVDLIRLCHLKPKEAHQAIIRWVVDSEKNMGDRILRAKKGSESTRTYPGVGEVPEYLDIVNHCLHSTDVKEVVRLVMEHRLPHEVVPSAMKNRVEVWEALLEHMPPTAAIRSLGKMTAVELLQPMSVASKTLARKLGDEALLRKQRVHPMSILLGMKVYEQGHGDKGKLTWSPVREVLDALDSAFYLSFSSVEPSRKRTLLAIDISGSMDSSYIAKTTLSARVAAGAMAMVTARVEDAWHAVGFTAGVRGEYRHTGCTSKWGTSHPASLSELKISPKQRLDDIAKTMSALPLGGTNCALPMMYAMDRGMGIDVFHVYTDNETWAGDLHPHQALRLYREKTGIAAKLIVVGMTATEFTIADPTDAGMLDVVGLDAAAPAVMADFAR